MEGRKIHMRILKDPEERKAEILDTAERLFTTKGYSKTTIMDILNEIGIAKGTFYYYFKSKEEVLDAIILRIVSTDVAEAKKIADNPNLSAIQKLFEILFTQKPEEGGRKEKMIEQFTQPNNAEMQQKGLVQSILHLTPILTRVVEQGINEKVVVTDYPHETVEFLLVSAQVIFDEGLFHWDTEEAIRRAKAFISIMEKALGTEKGSFDDMMKILINK